MESNYKLPPAFYDRGWAGQPEPEKPVGLVFSQNESRKDWIVGLEFKQGGDVNFGTGFYLNIPDTDKYVILTAGHNLIDGNGNRSTDLTIQGWPSIDSRDLETFVSDSYLKTPRTGDAVSDYGVILYPKRGDNPPDRGFGFSLKLGHDDLSERPLEISGYRAGKAVTSSGDCVFGKPVTNRPLSYNISTEKGQSGSPVIMPYGGHDTVVAIHTNGSKGMYKPSFGTRLTETVLGEIFDWVGVGYKNKSVKVFQPQLENSQGLYLRFPPDRDCAWVRLGNEGLETQFDIFPAYAPTPPVAKKPQYVFRFCLPPNWPGPTDKRWVLWDAVHKRVTLTNNLQELCFPRIIQDSKVHPELLHIVMEIPQLGPQSSLSELQMQDKLLKDADVAMGEFDTPEISFQTYRRRKNAQGLCFQ